jgi:imidazoleglycerol phosphate synthase glutamine amidotransferase subunit HisH
MNVRAVIVPGIGANYGSLRQACRRIGVDAAISDDRARIEAATHVLLPGVGAAGHAMRNLRERGLERVLREITQPLLGICLGMQLLFESSEESPEAHELARRVAAEAFCGSGFIRDALTSSPSGGRSGLDSRLPGWSRAAERPRMDVRTGLAGAGMREEGLGGDGVQGASRGIAAEAAPTTTIRPPSTWRRFPCSEPPCLGLLPGRVLRLPAAPSWPHMGWNRVIADQPTHPLLTGLGADDWFYFVHGYAAPVNAQTIAHSEHGEPFTAIVARDNVHGVQFHPEKSAAAGRRLLANFFALA